MRAEVRKAGVNRRTLGQGPLGSSRSGKTGGSVSHNVSHTVERLAGGGGGALGNNDIFSTGLPAGTRDAAMTAARFARADSAATSLSCGVNSSMVKMFLTAPLGFPSGGKESSWSAVAAATAFPSLANVAFGKCVNRRAAL